MKIATNFSIDATTYASQGNAVLGIRDSGKSYTATAIAEKLMEAGVPIIAFDPIGVWRNLKVGVNGKKGYPVVVAGENADLELTVESAPKIVRAAMRGNISLVLDLYSMRLSKADWKRIVQTCVELLLYENKPRGLRHIFLEEAAEFCPQRVGPDTGRVYAEIEKLARMGGNASLGYTLINQRAEEVNKAVLELCDCLFLHRQKGRHSLTALGKWLDVADAEDSRGIIKSLPTLSQGECWVWQQGSQKPALVKVLPKNSAHPDRRNPLAITKGTPMDVTVFVDQLKNELMKEAKINPLAPLERAPKKQPMEYTTLTGNQQEVAQLEDALRKEKARSASLQRTIEKLREALKPQYTALRGVFENLEDVEVAQDESWAVWLDKLHGKNREMLQVLIEAKAVTRQQLAFRAGISPNSGTFGTYLARLKSLGLIEKNGDQITLRQ